MYSKQIIFTAIKLHLVLKIINPLCSYSFPSHRFAQNSRLVSGTLLMSCEVRSRPPFLFSGTLEPVLEHLENK